MLSQKTLFYYSYKIFMDSILWILLALIVIFIVYVKIKFKVPKTGSLTLVTGGVKTGKSAVSLYFAIKTYNRIKRRVKFTNYFRKLFKKPLLEEPLFYSNIPVGIPYVDLTDALILRKERFKYRSVIWVDEASLFADSQMFRDLEQSELINVFNKLIGHETLGGAIFYNTQSIHDLHNGIKKCVDKYFYIHHLSKWIPFFLVASVREMSYSYDGDTINVYDEDVEQSLKKVLIPKSIFKKYDCYCYSILTDNLKVEEDLKVADTLKTSNILTFKREKIVGEVVKNERKNYKKFNR